jgi:hypothetical protein
MVLHGQCLGQCLCKGGREEKGGKGEYWECTHTTDIRRYCSSNMHVMYTYVYIEYIYHLS